jgi:hypothetical protein
VIDRDAAPAERVVSEIDGVPITADLADERSARGVVSELGEVDRATLLDLIESDQRAATDQYLSRSARL